MKSYDYIPRTAKIVARDLLTPDVVALRLKVADKKPFNFLPGQFVLLSVMGYGEVPVGITSVADKAGHFEVAVRAVGMVTNKIFDLAVGSSVGFNGPFGNGFALSKLKGRDVVLVAGGIGLPPLRSLIKYIESNPGYVKSLTILYGARSEDRLLYKSEHVSWAKFAKVYLAVESHGASWKGPVGSVAKLFERAEIKRGSVMIICGPPVMFPAVATRFAGKTVAEKDLYFLLERRMKCGIGKCQHCTCGELYVCLDGPVFSYDKLKYNPEAFK